MSLSVTHTAGLPAPYYAAPANKNDWQPGKGPASLQLSGEDVLSASSDPRVKNALSAIKQIEDVPDQIKARARDWAKKELEQLFKVLQVTLQNTPDSVHALKDLAKNISHAARDIAGGLSAPGGQNGQSDQSAQSASISTQTSISITETEQTQVLGAVSGDGNSSLAIYSHTETLQIQITQTTSVDFAKLSAQVSDAATIGEAAKAIAAIKAAIEKAARDRADHVDIVKAINNLVDGVKDSLRNIANDASALLSALPSASLIPTGNSQSVVA